MEQSAPAGEEILRQIRFILPKSRGRRSYRIFYIHTFPGSLRTLTISNSSISDHLSSRFSTSCTNGPRLLSRVKVCTHSPFGEKSHTRAFPSVGTAWLCVASEIATERTAGGSGCTPMACVRFRRHRGPAGLRDPVSALTYGIVYPKLPITK